MDKLITNLDTNLGAVLREQLDTNFQKIQNGVDGQADSLNKQIATMLGPVAPQNQNEVTQARIDANGNAYETLKGREDAMQKTAETALSEERTTRVEVQTARSDSSGNTYGSLAERMNNQEITLTNNMDANSAQIADNTSKIASLASGAPRAASLVADMTDHTKNYVYTGTESGYISGNWYYWNGGIWASGGVYQATSIANRSISNDKLAKLPLSGIPGKNLIDLAKAIKGSYVLYLDGRILPNTDYYATDYIEVSPSLPYRLSGVNGQFGYYDTNKVYITGYSAGSQFNQNAIPSNAMYVRFSIQVSKGEINTAQLELGSNITPYEPYKTYFDESTIKTPISKNRLEPSLLSGVRGKNLFDKSAVTKDYYIRNNDGALGALAGYYASDYISIDPNTSYRLSGTDEQFAYYDANKAYIIGYTHGAQINQNLTPSNAKYVRLSMKSAEIGVVQLERGTSITPYNPYGYFLNTDSLSSDTVEHIKSRINGTKRINVKTDGTGDFTSLVTAINSIKDSSATNVYDIYIYEDHDIIAELGGQSFVESLTSSSDRKGPYLPAYVNLHGVGMVTLHGEILKTWNAGYYAIRAISLLEIYQGFNFIENIKFVAKNMRYAVHDESNGTIPNTWVKWENVEFRHLGNDEFTTDHNGYWNSVAGYGMGSSSGTVRTFKNAIFDSTAYHAFLIHDNKDFVLPTRLEFNNSEFYNHGGNSGYTADIRLSTYSTGTVTNLAIFNNSIFKTIIIKNETTGTDNRWRVKGGGNSTSSIAESSLTVPTTITI